MNSLKPIAKERGFRGPKSLSEATGVPFRTVVKHWNQQRGIGSKWVFVYAATLDVPPASLMEASNG